MSAAAYAERLRVAAREHRVDRVRGPRLRVYAVAVDVTGAPWAASRALDVAAGDMAVWPQDVLARLTPAEAAANAAALGPWLTIRDSLHVERDPNRGWRVVGPTPQDALAERFATRAEADLARDRVADRLAPVGWAIGPDLGGAS